MLISRRKFLQAGAVAAFAVGVPLKTGIVMTGKRSSDPQPAYPNGAQASPTVKSDPVKSGTLASYTKATFAAYVNSLFLIKSKHTRAIEVKLIEVNDAGPVPDQQVAGRECFSLIFSGPKKLRQDVYTIDHAALGKFDLLLVPVGKDKKGSYYEALINRLN
jgi:hypothetical protein